MINNDILRRIRYIFDYSDTHMIDIFRLAEYQTTRVELKTWLKKEDEEEFVECPDKYLATFLNGLIIKNRGKKDDTVPVPEEHLTNNMVLMKLKIAMALSSDEVLDILTLAEFRISKHELSAFFRRAGHRHYRECLDQFLRNFLTGMKLKYRDKQEVQKDETNTDSKGDGDKAKKPAKKSADKKGSPKIGSPYGKKPKNTAAGRGKAHERHSGENPENKKRNEAGNKGTAESKKTRGESAKKTFDWSSKK